MHLKHCHRSVQIIAGVPNQEAAKAVDRVFARCSADLEPIGRRCADRDAANKFFSVPRPIRAYPRPLVFSGHFFFADLFFRALKKVL